MKKPSQQAGRHSLFLIGNARLNRHKGLKPRYLSTGVNSF